MRPKLSQVAQAAMKKLTASGPQGSDPFERMVAGKITGLSMELEQLNIRTASLREDLEVTEKTLTETVGEYQGWVESLAGYYQSQQTGRRPVVVADGGQMSGKPEPGPSSAQREEMVEAGGGLSEMPQDSLQDSPQEAGNAKGPDGHGDPAPASDGYPGQPDA